MSQYGPATVEEAPALYRSLLDDSEQPSAADARKAFARFAEIPFEGQAAPEADSLLFEYGVFGFTGQDLFTLSLVRQFETVDDGGEHELYRQLKVELMYEVDQGLLALGSHQAWYQGPEEESLAAYLATVSSDPCWDLVQAGKARSVEIYLDEI